MRKIKAWGATHPDEEPTNEIADSLLADPLLFVQGGIVNVRARQLGRRQLNINMNKAYPGDLNSPVYEERRAAEVVAESEGFYSVIDMHTLQYHGEDTAWIGTRGVSWEILGFLSHIGITRLVRTYHNTMHEHVKNCFLLEVSHKSERSSVGYMRRVLSDLATTPSLPKARAAEFEWYTYAHDFHIDRMHPSQYPTHRLRPFQPMPDDLAERMGCPPGAVYPLNWKDEPNAQGYWGEIAQKIPPPDDSRWPLELPRVA